MKHKHLIFPIVLLSIFAGCSQPQTTSNTENKAVKIRSAMVKSLSGTQPLSYSGTIIPFQSIPVTFQTSGTVQTVLVDEGTTVRKGQILATLDKTDSQNMYNVTEAQYQQALDAYNRLKEVHDKGSLAEIKWVEMESNLKQAESSMKLAKNNLSKTILTAPESGIIGKRNIEPGMSSIGITAPFEVVKIDRIYVRLSVPENEIARIKSGMTAKFVVSAIGDDQYTGQVSIVGVVADQFSRTYEVKVLADNPGNIIKPGMICDLTLESEQSSTNVVDYRAVTHDTQGTFVYKLDASRSSVIKQTVKTGRISHEGIEILSGLQPGDEVVCEGIEKVSNNSKIVL